MASSTQANDRPEMKVTVRFIGPDPDRGRMNAIELGPAIFGLGRMFSRASKILYGDDARVTLEVRADFERASFGIEFIAVAVQLGEVFADLSREDLRLILDVLGITGSGGLLAILFWLQGRKVDKIEKTGDQVSLTVHDESLTVNINEYQLLSDSDVREASQALVAPMDREGVEAVEMTAEDESPKQIKRAQREYFRRYSLPDEEVSVDRSTAILEVIGPVFREGNRWRFAQGEQDFHAEIVDESFLERVSRHEYVFGRGDALRVRLEIETRREGDKLRFDRRVLEVLEVMTVQQASQLRLPVEDVDRTRDRDETPE